MTCEVETMNSQTGKCVECGSENLETNAALTTVVTTCRSCGNEERDL
jgi:uncharacterized protein (DUF983 family)